MRTTEELKQNYNEYLDFLRCGLFEKLEKYSVEELEKMADFYTHYSEDGYKLFDAICRVRKQKMNEVFVLSKEHFDAFIKLDKKLKECCLLQKKTYQRLMSETKREDFFVTSRLEFDDNYLNPIICKVLSMSSHFQLFYLSEVSEDFDLESNYADKLFAENTQIATAIRSQLSNCHIGYAFYTLYHESCFSLQDMLKIEGIDITIQIATTIK